MLTACFAAMFLFEPVSVYFSSVLLMWDKPRFNPMAPMSSHPLARCPFLAQVFSVDQLAALKGTQQSVYNACCNISPATVLWGRAVSQDCASD